MTICFPTAACVALDFITAAGLASRLGFDGVELHAFDDPSIGTATNALLTSPGKIGRIFSDANVAVSSLNVGPAADQLSGRIALAAELHCPSIRFQCDELFSRSPAGSKLAVDRLRDDADLAAAAGITLLIENRPIAGSAIAMWHLLDRIDHPAVACCWNTLPAFIAGDSPAVAVPTLNSRIQCVLIRDAQATQPSGLPPKGELGTDEIPIRKTLDRLRGIGFRHTLIVSPPIAPSMDVLEQSLIKSLDALRQWNILPAQVAPT